MNFQIYDLRGHKIRLFIEEDMVAVSINEKNIFFFNYPDFKNLYIPVCVSLANKEHKRIYFDSFYTEIQETFLQEVYLVFYEDIGYNVEINKPILTLEMSRGLFFDFTKMVTRLFDFLGFADQDWVVI